MAFKNNLEVPQQLKSWNCIFWAKIMLDKTKTKQITVLDLSNFLEGDEATQFSLASELSWIQEKIGTHWKIK